MVDPKLGPLFILGSLNSVATWYRKDSPFSIDTVVKTYVDMTRATLVGSAPANR